ncbi:Asparagine--tRNA ligase [Candidatus Ecksteinia adelgidicola]|nr:Asparagine--tRNA ligase [Candidatus Ecksteinia adelgidicola]
MKTVSIAHILYKRIDINTEVIVRGWVRTRRDSKLGISFLVIYDGSCLKTLQAIVSHSLLNYKSEVLHLTTGCSVEVSGIVVMSLGKNQIYDLKVNAINVIGWVDNPDTYPMAAKRHNVEHLRESTHLRPRTNLIGVIARIRHTLAQAIHQYYHKNGFFWVSTPIITTSDTEGAGKMFRVSTLDLENLPRTNKGVVNFSKDFFGKETFLTVSGQLNAESYACALSKIYTFGPTFRAENSNTSRHLSEFWMIETEIAFSTLNDIVILAQNMLKNICQTILTERIDDMKFLTQCIDQHAIHRLECFVSSDFIEIEYIEAIKILIAASKKFEHPVFFGIDLSSEHERYLTDKYFENSIVIKNYPKNIKAFYTRINDDNKTVAAMDILLPGIGEIIGGSQREERLNILDQRLLEMKLNKEDYTWYRDLRRYGTVPHAGFGLGFERLISYITGVKNIRDVIPFPRTPNNANF